MVVDSVGNIHAIWTAAPGGTTRVYTASREPTAPVWSATTSLGTLAGASAISATIDVDDRIIVLATQTGEDAAVVAMTLAADGLRTKTTITSAVDFPDAPAVVATSQGDVVVGWTQTEGANYRVSYSRLADASANWSAPAYLADTASNAFGPALAAEPGGRIVAAWRRSSAGTQRVEAEISTDGGATWGPPIWVADGSAADGRPAIAMSGAGEATVLYTHGNDLQSSTLPSTSNAWSAPASLTDASAAVVSRTLRYDGSNNVIAAWVRGGVVWSANRPAGSSTWSAPAVVSGGAATAGQMTMATAPSGSSGTIVWYETGVSIQAVGFANGGTQLQDKVSVAYVSAYPYLSAAYVPDGTPTVLFSDDFADPAGRRPAVSSLDSAGPALRGVSVPAVGTVGQSLGFSVEPFDALSTVGVTTWVFGDGSSAVGESVTHAYTAEGSYDVQVTSTDLFGNSSSQSATVAVTRVPVAEPANPPAGDVAPGAGPDAPSQPITDKPAAKPTVTKLTLSSSRYRVGKKRVKTRKLKTFSRLTVRTTGASTVSVRVSVPRSGHRKGKACSTLAKKGKRCTRTMSFTVKRKLPSSGQRVIRFDKAVDRRKLRPGLYALRVTAAGPSGQSASRTIRVRILR